jgi:hypothetical protein
VRRDGGSLLILSATGQEAVKRRPYHGELGLNDATKLATAIGFRHPFKSNLPMQPAFNFEVPATTPESSSKGLSGYAIAKENRCGSGHVRKGLR